MSVFNYSKYKIIIDPESHKTQGLSVGDVVRRQYADANKTVYSLMLVLETGVDTITGENNTSKQSPYFVGALLDGEAPVNGQLLDFVRVTNMFNTKRTGALYLTASDSESPYMDAIDGMSMNNSLSYPSRYGGEAQNDSRDQYNVAGDIYLTAQYTDSIDDASRVLRLVRNSVAIPQSKYVGLRQVVKNTLTNPQRIVVSYKIRASKTTAFQAVFGEWSDKADAVYNVNTGTEWAYKAHVVTVDYKGDRKGFYLDVRSILTSNEDWCEISDFNIVLLSDLISLTSATKARVGKLSGVIDPLFGVLDGYGAYFQNLFATKNVNIAGTLTAGDENGSASTFYVGKIHKNVFLNSLRPQFTSNKHTELSELSPSGTGLVYQLQTGESVINAQSKKWLSDNVNLNYCFSFWIKSDSLSPIQVSVGEGSLKHITPSTIGEWERVCVSATLANPHSTALDVSIIVSDGSVLFSAPQLESGNKPTLYQPTDATLNYTNEYGAWFSKGGIGGTIQNPLLKLNEDGSISSANGSFVIKSDGSGYFAGGEIQWNNDGVTFGENITLEWDNLSDEAKTNLKGEKGATGATGATGAAGKDGKNGTDANMLNWVVDWDSAKTTINSTTILTPKIFAGTKNANNTITGVAMGKFPLQVSDSSGNISTENINGVYGFNNGKKTFSIDNTGAVKIGSDQNSISYNPATGKVEFGDQVALEWQNYTTNTVNNLAIGARNYVLDTATTKKIEGQNKINQSSALYQISQSRLYLSEKTCTVSFDWFAVGEDIRGSFLIQNQKSPWGSVTSGINIAGAQGTNKYTRTFTLSSGDAVSMTAVDIRLDNVPLGTSISISNFSLVLGNKGAGWSEAPEDTQARIDAAKAVADAAKITANEAADRLSNWASDAYISPSEKTALKQQKSDIQSEYLEIKSQATAKSLLTSLAWVSFDSGYASAISSLTKYTASSPENIAVGSDYANIEAYYTKRQAILDAIAAATKTDYETLVNNVSTNSRNFCRDFRSWTKGDVSASFLSNDRVKVKLTKTVNGGYGSNLISRSGDCIIAINVKAEKAIGFYIGTRTSTIYKISHTSILRSYNTELCMFNLPAGFDDRLIVCFKANNILNANFYVGLEYGHEGNEVELSYPQFIKANKITDWTPAVEDVEAAIATAQTTADNTTNALGGSSFPKLTKIDATGIYTGTLTAAQVNAVDINASSIKTGTLSADRIGAGSITSSHVNASSLQSSLITASYIQGLSLNFSKGKIGNWVIGAETITNGNVSLSSAGSLLHTGNKWALNTDGSGRLGNGAIAWDTNGNITFSSAVKLQWTQYTDSAVSNVRIGGRNLVIDSNFHNRLAHWKIRGTAVLSIDEATVLGNSLSIRVKSTASGHDGFNAAKPTLSFKQNQQYTLSFWAYRDSSTAAFASDRYMRVYMPELSGTNTLSYHHYLSINDINLPDKTWTLFSRTFTTLNGTGFGYLSFDYSNNSSSEMNVWITNIKLEIGNQATDWTPAPEDASLDIATVQENVNSIQIGGCNLFLGSKKFKSPEWIVKGAVSIANDTYNGISYYTTNTAWSAYVYEKTSNIKTDRQYVMSFYAKLSSASSVFTGSLYSYGISNSTLVVNSKELSSEWKRFYVSGKYSQGQNIRIEPTSNVTNGYICICALKLEEGNKPTDWTEAPEDIQERIDAADAVAISAQNTANSSVAALGGLSFPKLTKIDATGVYTGTLTATQVNAVAINASSITTGTLAAGRIAAGSLSGDKITAGTLSADRITSGSITSTQINVSSLQSALITTTYIQGLSLNFTQGKIGEWTIGSTQISAGSTNLLSSGSIANTANNATRWGLWYDGSGTLASGNITWNAQGDITFANSVKLNWTQYTDSAIDNIKIGGRNFALNTSSSWATPVTLDSGINKNYFATTVQSDGWNVNDVICVTIEYKHENLVKGAGGRIILQGSGNVTGWNAGTFGGKDITHLIKEGTGSSIISYKTTVQPSQLLNSYFSVTIRHDNIQGSVSIRNFKVEIGTTATAWSPAPEDIVSGISKAQLAAEAANASLALLNDDTVLDILEKQRIRTEWERVHGAADTISSASSTGSYLKVKSAAESIGLATTALDSYYTALKSYLNANTLYTNSNVTGFSRSTLSTNFKNYYTEELVVLDKISKGYSDTVVVGGRNLVRNASFKYSSSFPWGNYHGSHSIVSDETFGNVAKVIKNVGSSNGGIHTVPINRVSGTKYTASAYLKADYVTKVSFSFEGNPAVYTVLDVTTEWKRYILTGIWNKGTYSSLFLRAIADGYFYVANVQFEEGDKATSWSEAPEDTEMLISTAQAAADSSISALGGASFPKLTKIDATGVYTGTLTATQVNAIAINASSITTGTLSTDRIASGSIDAGKINVSSLQSALITTSYIQGLSLSFTQGTIGSWSIGANALYHSIGGRYLIINNAASDSAAGSNRGHRGITLYSDDSAVTDGAVKVVQIGALANKNTAAVWGGENDYGFRICIKNGKDIFRADSTGAQIAGWAFNDSAISKGSISLGSDGTIKHATAWALNSDGSGKLAKGDISWDASGNVTINENVVISGSAVANAISTQALAVGAKFKVSSDGVLTATDGVFSGTVSGVSGTFTSLKAYATEGSDTPELTFGSYTGFWMYGDLRHQGQYQGRLPRFYGADIWCRGGFGHYSKTTLISYGTYGYVYSSSSATPTYISFTKDSGSGAYKIPLYSPTDSLAGMPIDIVLIKVTSSYKFYFDHYRYKTVDVMNLNDNYNDINLYTNGKTYNLGGGCCVHMMCVDYGAMLPTVSSSAIGAGWVIVGDYDNNYH